MKNEKRFEGVTLLTLNKYLMKTFIVYFLNLMMPGAIISGAPEVYGQHFVSVGVDNVELMVGQTEVTWETYNFYKEDKRWIDVENLKCAVTGLTYREALSLCEQLNKVVEGYTFRLPTLREWSLICKQGVKEQDEKERFVWALDSIEDMGGGLKCRGVYSKQGDLNGIYHLRGNVREWCSDLIFEKELYEGSGFERMMPFADALEVGIRPLAGGSSVDPYEECNCASFTVAPEVSTSNTFGMRLIAEETNPREEGD